MNHDPGVPEIVGNMRVERGGFPIIENSLKEILSQSDHQFLNSLCAGEELSPGIV